MGSQRRLLARLMPWRWWPPRHPEDIPEGGYYIPAFDRRLPKGWATYSPETSRKRWWILLLRRRW
jgi:hypothetical protein